ncbi:MAG: hypothetical protein HY898_27600 [Deltaproteobacteria bacterium]|nr:hypothetical protein [Deltaproteobacteria bacterium]
MARASIAESMDALFKGVISPLVLGGQLTPTRPIGPARAQKIARASGSFGAAEVSWVNTVRARHARQFCRVDSIESPSPAQWAMAAALNDLLQSTNPTLDGAFSKRGPILIGKVEETLRAIQGPGTIREALSRHATFARVLEIVRRDTRVTWWCGSREFRGSEPPARLMKWKNLRRVGTDESTVPMADMSAGTPIAAMTFYGALGLLLSLSPLTDLATASRAHPQFHWSEPTLALLAAAPGRVLAARALRLGNAKGSIEAVRQAGMPQDPAWKAAVQSVLDELSAFGQAG